jgi:hypothetical protein
MGTKADPGPFNCHAAAAPDEPIFTLLARDKHAALLVNLWAVLRALDRGPDDPKVVESCNVVDAMNEYLRRKHPDVTPSDMHALARAVPFLAHSYGAVMEITPRVQPPLAMGNYGYEVRVWPRREPAA